MRLKIAAVLVVTVVCLVGVLWGIDPAVVAVSLGDFQWGWLFAVFAIYCSAHALRVWRLRLILGVPVPFMRLLSILSIGYLAIHVVPLRMGEFVRPALLSEKEGVPFGAGLAAIFIERLVDMVMLLGMMLLVSFAVDLPDGKVVVQGIDVLQAGQRAVGSLVAVGTVGLVVLLVVGEPLLRLTDKLPMGAFPRKFRDGILTLARRPAALAIVFALSLVIWAITVLAVQLTLFAFPGLPHAWGDALTVWAVTLAGMTAAPTPGFFGGFEAFCSAALYLLGAEVDRARTFAVILHLGQFIFTIAAGLVFLVYEGVSLRDVVSRSRSVAAP
jgi:uncharacterized membrane protein YbhN (UPF0104 family)